MGILGGEFSSVGAHPVQHDLVRVRLYMSSKISLSMLVLVFSSASIIILICYGLLEFAGRHSPHSLVYMTRSRNTQGHNFRTHSTHTHTQRDKQTDRRLYDRIWTLCVYVCVQDGGWRRTVV